MVRRSGSISVIVPVYNVEKYIEECVESILGQTYEDLELLLIDDGSSDHSGAICDRYAQQDSRVVVLHQKNSGAAAARNAGLRAARGEFIAFADGDDYLERDAYEKMVRALRDNDADIVQGGFRMVYANGAELHDRDAGIHEFSTAGYLARFLRDWTCALCWDKLFRHTVLSDVFFEEGHLIDDEFFTYQGVMNAGKILCIPQIVYNYRQRASSIMKDPVTTERKNFDNLEAMEKRRKDVLARFPELSAQYEHHYADWMLYLAGSDCATRNTILEIKKRLLAYVASGKVLPWKDGQRKLFLRILSFWGKSAESMLRKRKEERKKGGYEFFE